MKKIIENISVIIAIVMLAWIVLSFNDINTHNKDTNPQYNKYNLFILVSEVM